MTPLRTVRGKSWTSFKFLILFFQGTKMDENSRGSFVFQKFYHSLAVIPPFVQKICTIRGLRHQSGTLSSILRLEKNVLCGRI